MRRVTSKDGTSIAFDELGSGPAVILIGGGPTDRSANAPLADLLAADFTVLNYDRRARGDSGDTRPYAVVREYEDLAAVIEHAGGSAMVYGTSGGGMFGLAAAAYGLPITRLAVWEVPYDPEPRPPSDYKEQLESLLAAGRHGDMIEAFFIKAVGTPAEFVAGLRQSPFWAVMEDAAPALVYDATIAGDFSIPADKLAKVSVPTLVVDGGTVPWMTRSADAVAAILPDARRAGLPGQPHNVAPDAIAPALTEFFGA